MNKKNSLLLAGLMLLGTGCTSQLEAFNLKNLVPACIQQYIECKKLEHEKAALKRRKADIRQYLTYIEQEISDLLERLCIQEKIRCQFNIHVGPDF